MLDAPEDGSLRLKPIRLHYYSLLKYSIQLMVFLYLFYLQIFMYFFVYIKIINTRTVRNFEVTLSNNFQIEKVYTNGRNTYLFTSSTFLSCITINMQFLPISPNISGRIMKVGFIRFPQNIFSRSEGPSRLV
jgi:hypothetical protein